MVKQSFKTQWFLESLVRSLVKRVPLLVVANVSLILFTIFVIAIPLPVTIHLYSHFANTVGIIEAKLCRLLS